MSQQIWVLNFDFWILYWLEKLTLVCATGGQAPNPSSPRLGLEPTIFSPFGLSLRWPRLCHPPFVSSWAHWVWFVEASSSAGGPQDSRSRRSAVSGPVLPISGWNAMWKTFDAMTPRSSGPACSCASFSSVLSRNSTRTRLSSSGFCATSGLSLRMASAQPEMCGASSSLQVCHSWVSFLVSNRWIFISRVVGQNAFYQESWPQSTSFLNLMIKSNCLTTTKVSPCCHRYKHPQIQTKPSDRLLSSSSGADLNRWIRPLRAPVKNSCLESHRRVLSKNWYAWKALRRNAADGREGWDIS